MMEVIETTVDTAIADIICGNSSSAKLFVIGIFYLPPPPFSILTKSKSYLRSLAIFSFFLLKT
jgi:hypothetical protein